ncbi:Iron-sulfur assembly protein 2 [Cytospora mali]|uniref:Iron-sulfur assembly protein 2 n=1 Tax=Cytospora mali TaxID=578113 RepID=A0A194VNG5_CYTMA|nr:Iron-sulfur assembly protein 2 [Valsa mali]
MVPFASPVSCAHSASAAKLFVQLAPRGAPSQPVLDFLVPRGHAAISTSARAFRSVSARPPPTNSNELPRAVGWRIPRGMLSGLSARPAPPPPTTVPYMSSRSYTQAVYNPQNDEDGNEMKMEITPRAAKRLSDIMTKDSNPHLALRIQVESGGCHGFQYLMSLVTLPESLPTRPAAGAQPSEHPGDGAESGEVREDDTIFTYTAEEGQESDLTAPKIILDQPSLDLLKGSKVDFTMELIGSQFKIVDNPLATSSCGCGTSFDIKI